MTVLRPLHSRHALVAALVGVSLITVAGAATTQATTSVAPTRIVQASTDVLVNNGVLNAGGELRASNDAYRFAFQTDSNLVIYRNADNEVMWASNTQGKGGTKLHMQTTGNLAMLDKDNATVWETRTTVTDATGKATILRLETNGELRLVRNGTAVWNTPADPDAPKPVPTTPRPTATSPRPTSQRPTPVPSTSRPIPSNTSSRPTPTATGKKTDQLVPGQKFLVGNGLYSKNDRFVFGMADSGDVFVLDIESKKLLWSLGTADKNAYQFTMLRDGNLAVQRRDGATIWNTTIPNDSRRAAKLIMQDDGNCVLYYGDEAVWATNTNQEG